MVGLEAEAVAAVSARRKVTIESTSNRTSTSTPETAVREMMVERTVPAEVMVERTIPQKTVVTKTQETQRRKRSA